MEYIAYSGCGEKFSLKEVEADIAVFYGDGGKPEKEEMALLADYFPDIPRRCWFMRTRMKSTALQENPGAGIHG